MLLTRVGNAAPSALKIADVRLGSQAKLLSQIDLRPFVPFAQVPELRFYKLSWYGTWPKCRRSNGEPGGGRTHDIHLKRVLLYH